MDTERDITRLTIQHRTHLHSPPYRERYGFRSRARAPQRFRRERTGRRDPHSASFELVEVSRIRVPTPLRLADASAYGSPRPGTTAPDERTSDYWGRRAGPARARARRGGLEMDRGFTYAITGAYY